MAGTNFLAGQSSVWVQPKGPNTEPKYLGCHSVGDIPEPKGDSTLLWCPDPAQVGKFVVKNSFKGEPGTITTSIETDLRRTADYLEDLADKGCPFPLYVHKVSCGRRDVFSNFDRSFVLRGVEVTQSNLSALASRNPADEGESLQSFDLSVREVLRVFNLELTRVSIAETEDITALSVCGENVCEGDCGAEESPEDSLFAASNALVGSISNTATLLSTDEDGVWSPSTGDPFTGGEAIQGVICFKMSKTVTRVIVANGTTDGAATASIAYSDDGGATWTSVDVGTVLGDFIASGNALHGMGRYNLWLGTNGGRIYKSTDAGETWTLTENAVIAALPVMGISMVDGDIGFAVYSDGTVAKTVDGTSWSQVGDSGSLNATDIKAISSYTAWVAGSDGLFYTKDGGTTFNVRNTYNVGAIDFLNELFGIAAGGAVNGNVWMTFNGGYDWMAVPAVVNGGFTDVKIISTKLAYVSGYISGGTGFIGKLIPA